MTPLIQETPQQIESRIESRHSFWRVYSPHFEGYNVPAIDISRKLLPERSQEEHIQQAQQAYEKGKFRAVSMLLYHRIFKELYLMRENEQYRKDVERARTFLEKTMDEDDLITLSHLHIRQMCARRKHDKIIHNVGLKNQGERYVDIVSGSDNESLDPAEICVEILGSSNTDEAHEIYSWLRPQREARFSFPRKREPYEQRDILAFQGSDSWGIIGTASFNWAHHAIGIRFVTPLVLQKTQKKVKKTLPLLPYEWQGKDIEIEPYLQKVYGEDELKHSLALAEQGGHLSPEKTNIVRKILFSVGGKT